MPEWDIKLGSLQTVPTEPHTVPAGSPLCVKYYQPVPLQNPKQIKKTTPKWLNQFSVSNTKPRVEKKTNSSKIPSHQSPQNLYTLLLLCWGWKKKKPQTADVGFVTFSVLEEELWTRKVILCCANSKTLLRSARSCSTCRAEAGTVPSAQLWGAQAGLQPLIPAHSMEGKEQWERQRSKGHGLG